MSNWFEKFDEKHPRLAQWAVICVLLLAMGVAGYLDQPLQVA